MVSGCYRQPDPRTHADSLLYEPVLTTWVYQQWVPHRSRSHKSPCSLWPQDPQRNSAHGALIADENYAPDFGRDPFARRE